MLIGNNIREFYQRLMDDKNFYWWQNYQVVHLNNDEEHFLILFWNPEA